MIAKDSLQPEWIQKVSAENRKADKILIEKCIRDLSGDTGIVLKDIEQSALCLANGKWSDRCWLPSETITFP